MAYKRTINSTNAVELRNIGKFFHKIMYKLENIVSNV
jgi:hypothetical protein